MGRREGSHAGAPGHIDCVVHVREPCRIGRDYDCITSVPGSSSAGRQLERLLRPLSCVGGVQPCTATKVALLDGGPECCGTLAVCAVACAAV